MHLSIRPRLGALSIVVDSGSVPFLTLLHQAHESRGLGRDCWPNAFKDLVPVTLEEEGEPTPGEHPLVVLELGES